MQEPTTTKSLVFSLSTYLARHRWLQRGVRVAIWLAVLLIGVLAAITVALHAWILPQINDFRPKIEQFAAKSLGTPVSIGNITTINQGWRSEIELRQVNIINAQGQNDLHIDTVQISVSPWRLLRRGVNRLILVRPAVQVRRMQNGAVYVAGVLAYDPKKENQKNQKSNTGLNWLLNQNTLKIQNGSITWHDAMRRVAPLRFSALNIDLTNTEFLHVLQAQVQAPTGWGNTITLQGRWRHGLTQAAGNWKTWTGKARLATDNFNANAWQQYIDFGDQVNIRQASGKLVLNTQWYADNKRNLTIDTTLDAVDIQFANAVTALALKNVSAQLDIRTSTQRNQAQSNNTYSIATKKLTFTTANGQSWKNGHIAASMHTTPEYTILGGSLQAHGIDMALISHIGQSLPLQPSIRTALEQQKPQGTLKKLELSWQGTATNPTGYKLSARGKNLAWLAKPSEKLNKHGRPTVGVPGGQGIDVEIDLNQAGGKLQLKIHKGYIELPGVFEDPRLYFDHLNGKLNWTINNGHIRANLTQLQLANEDLQADAQAQWYTQPNTVKNSTGRFPGVLDLKGTIHRAQAEKMVRYLPLTLGNKTLRYIGAAIRSGNVHNARVRIQGNLRDIPFNKKSTGVFNFQVPLRNTEFAFMPRYLQKSHEKPWPSLVKLNGLLVIDKNSLNLSKVTTQFNNAPDVRIRNLAAHIPNLGNNLTVGVAANLNGSLQQLFDVTRTSPLSGIINHALDTATATGNTNMQLKLGLPIGHMHKSIVRGSVQLHDNDVRITPETPLMAKSTGNIQFDEHGFNFKKIRTQLLGGRATLQGGTVQKGKSTVVQFKALGTLSGKGLRNEPTVNTVAALGKFMRGTTPYTAQLNYRAGVPELTLKTNLVGMELKLPHPLGKPSNQPMPFYFANTIYKTDVQQGASKAIQDQVQLKIGNLVQAQYVRSLRPNESAQVIQGSIAVGHAALENAPELPRSGVEALILLENFNADAWLAVLEKGWGTNNNQTTAENTIAKDNTVQADTEAPTAAAAPAVATPVTQETIASRYLPNLVDMQTEKLTLNNLNFNNLVVSGSREGRLWKLSLAAKEVIGHIEYLQALRDGAGAVKARLNRLILVPAGVEQVSSYVRQTTDPKTLPLLDVEAENVEYTSYKMNRIKILASNSAKRNIAGADLVDEKINPNISNAWYIHNLQITMPYSDLQGKGVWEVENAYENAQDNISNLLARQVFLQVRMYSKNLGALVEHLGYKKMAKKGSGLLSGSIRWDGSPVSPNLETLSGDMRVDVRNGSITRINPGAAKFLGLLSLQGLTRLGDIAEKGFTYNRIQGRLLAENGNIRSNNLAIEGSLADVKASGEANLLKQSLNLGVVVLPKIDLSAAALLTSTINPIIGIGSYLAQWIISKPLSRMARQVLSITGTWDDPKVQKLKGKQATTAARKILRAHDLPTAFDQLWDWSPITNKNRPQGIATPLSNATAAPAH